jgi:hypothetical protein
MPATQTELELDTPPREGGLTWDEIARELGITRRQAQLICDRALFKLRARMLAAGIDHTVLHSVVDELPTVVFAALYACDVPLVEMPVVEGSAPDVDEDD